MSQRKAGREWIPESPASASAADPIAVLGRLSTDTLIPQGGAGPVERRQANEVMRAAWRREELPDLPAAAPVPTRMTEDELVGAYRSAVDPVIAAGAEEEPDMDEPERPVADNALTRLAAAAEEAAEAVEAFEAARIRRSSAVDALKAAWDALGLTVEPETPTNGAAAAPTPALKHRARRRPGGDAERSETVAERAARVLEVLDRHGGDTKAAGDELGMRGNVVARIASSARRRAAAAS